MKLLYLLLFFTSLQTVSFPKTASAEIIHYEDFLVELDWIYTNNNEELLFYGSITGGPKTCEKLVYTLSFKGSSGSTSFSRTMLYHRHEKNDFIHISDPGNRIQTWKRTGLKIHCIGQRKKRS